MENYKITENEMNSGVIAAPNTLVETAQDNKSVFDRLPKLIARKFNGFVDAVTEKLKGYYTAKETDTAINNKMLAMSNGDMAESKYDTNGDGTVNDSDKLGGKTPEHYATAEEMAEMMPKANFQFDADTQTLHITL